MTKTLNLLIALLAAIAFGACQQQAEKLTPQEAKEIAKEAYIYGFPMVMNYKTLYAYALEPRSPEYKGAFNQMACDARVFTPEDKAVVTPNSDTPYCMFWCNISTEPAVISVPDIDSDRYYSFQLIDLYTHNFAYLGTLTTGNKAGKYLIVPSTWKGETPEGISAVIPCESKLFFTVVRTQLMNENDIDNVRAIQNTYQLQTLSEFIGESTNSIPSISNFPTWIEGEQLTVNAFKYLDFMLDLTDPVDKEKELLERFKKIGLGTENSFDTTQFSPEILQAMKEGISEGLVEIKAFIKQNGSDPLASAKIFGTREFLTQSAQENYNLEDLYLPRAVAAQTGLYGNSGFEATYPTYRFDAEGQPLNASKNKYSVTFKEGELPPVKAFWSLTIYDGLTQLLVDNPLNRYLLNSSMQNDFIYGEDGSLTLYIQKDSPGKELEANWLPAPNGPFYCVLRLYGPTPEALEGIWINPPMVSDY